MSSQEKSIGNDPACHSGNKVVIKEEEEGKKKRVITQLVLEEGWRWKQANMEGEKRRGVKFLQLDRCPYFLTR
ncbi:hypothetical protein BTUL_0021g00150 [Botrytis tulipae]|uniref:Uncharacterized protein n=1 Tax=Botrytis tulipae TaxID=87230 RepID=A0A4Z1F0D8_9HELO|nr:hypothetical protein BTUL_0021g00150 [Botrytis tulipae]